MTSTVKFFIIAFIAAALMWFTASVQAALMPFVFAAVLAYITAPLAEKLEGRLPAAAAACIIVLLVLLLLVIIPLALMPLIAAQIQQFADLLPPLMERIHAYLGSDINSWLKQRDLSIKSIGSDNIKKATSVIFDIFNNSLTVLLSFLNILLITPLATFYFLRDRKSIGGELTEVLPPRIRDYTLTLSRDLDNVLGEFLHGQLIVMVVMAVFYSLVLRLADLPFALTIGIISGVLTFIPYVGFILGLTLATIVGLGSYESFLDVVIVWVLMGIGTIIESILITPRLVGERVGLHPLAVLLALMVMGELLGFAGVLVALPAASLFLVCGRHLRRRYINSGFYAQQ